MAGKALRAPRRQLPLDSARRRLVNAAHPLDGAVAQLGERVVRNDEVRGSIPLGSTNGLENKVLGTGFTGGTTK